MQVPKRLLHFLEEARVQESAARESAIEAHRVHELMKARREVAEAAVHFVETAEVSYLDFPITAQVAVTKEEDITPPGRPRGRPRKNAGVPDPQEASGALGGTEQTADPGDLVTPGVLAYLMVRPEGKSREHLIDAGYRNDQIETLKRSGNIWED